MKNQPDFKTKGEQVKQKGVVKEEKGKLKKSEVTNLEWDFPETEHPHKYTTPEDMPSNPKSEKGKKN